MTEPANPRRLMILCTTTGYQTRAFVETAARMGLDIAFGSDRCHMLEDPWRDGAIPLRFEDPEGAARQILEYARRHPVQGIVALGDGATPAAARASQLLGLPYHPPRTAEICRDKYRSRERLRGAGLNVPKFARFPLTSDPDEVLRGDRLAIPFPCVLKPLALSASRGVIRANNPDEFVQSFERVRKLLRSPEVQVMRENTSEYIQVEEYIDGAEVAVEGLVMRGQTKILAIFDKPDPLEGPFFEETIYVTPARLSPPIEAQLRSTLKRAICALELFHGPFHAELRINSRGIWPLEIAARSIGGLCSRALRFRSPAWGEDISLERVVIALALGENVSGVRREELASGVMMIPVEEEGIYEDVRGVEQALEIPQIDDIIITAKPGQQMVPWPEGCSYPGFIFGHGRSPESVEQALRRAYRRLQFQVAPALPVLRA
ncbi:MAG TPA: ATP-grasp domain-containing protein [Terriglobia bacterium]|nr:ATP-grasp domain-containing protein [Terriglobia bacterium]